MPILVSCVVDMFVFIIPKKERLMKKVLFAVVAMVLSTAAMAEADHYILRDGNHVQHLKIAKIGDDTHVAIDVDFEPNTSEQGKQACSADISGDAKWIGDKELVLKKQVDGERRHCLVNIKLTDKGAILDQSEDCNYFVTGICHFSSGGKELVKIR